VAFFVVGERPTGHMSGELYIARFHRALGASRRAWGEKIRVSSRNRTAKDAFLMFWSTRRRFVCVIDLAVTIGRDEQNIGSRTGARPRRVRFRLN
jgi:hypothetical protein